MNTTAKVLKEKAKIIFKKIIDLLRKIKWKVISKWAGNIILGVLVVLFIVTVYMSIAARRNNGVPTFFGYKPMTVLTGSMRPKINPGDIVVDKTADAKDIQVGDIITYRDGNSNLITHRVTQKAIQSDGAAVYVTRGDSNNLEDENPVLQGQVIGKLVIRVPYIGFLASFASSKIGFIFLIWIPVIILVADQISIFVTEIKKEKNSRRSTEDNKKN